MQIRPWMGIVAFIVLGVSVDSRTANAAAALDNSLEPTKEENSNAFQEMGVVQKKAMKKRSRFLLSTYLSLDFSDGPYTNYSLHANPGYAVSDFLEIYVSFAPTYLVSPRSIVAKVDALSAPGGGNYTITAEKPKYEYGIEVLWAPLYGKDSLGVSSIIRSDTFFKFGATQVKYETTNGLSFKVGVGKTFFLGNSLGFRFCVDYDMVQTVIDSKKSFNGLLLTELGMMFYF